MQKPKKITVKHILKTQLKPTVINGENYYSVYVLMTVNRTSTSQPSKIIERFTSIEIAKKKYFNELETERQSIENAIRKKLLLDSNYSFKIPKKEMIKQKKSIIRRLQIKLKKEQTELLQLEQYNLF